MGRMPCRKRLRIGGKAFAAAGALFLAAADDAHSRITQIVIDSRAVAFGGASFGEVGQYEQLDGTAYGEVDPDDPLNAVIQDVGLAPRNARGMVEYSTDISILKPVDSGKGNGALLYDVVNRGNKLALTGLNVGVTADNPAGDGFLQRQGFTLVWSGWQGDLVRGTGLLGMTVPVAHWDRDPAATITGVVRSEYGMLAAPASTQPILGAFSSASVGYAPVSLDNAPYTLTRRVHEVDPRERIPNSRWAFADCSATPFPGVPDERRVCLEGGFDTDHIYELVYEAKDPLVLGLGFASTRDLVSHLRASDDGGNPLAGGIDRTLAYGASQSGRYLRSFLDLGFNESEDHRPVFEGVASHIATARVALNIRFGQPGRISSLQHTEHSYPGPESPATWAPYDDPISRVKAGLLDRCRATGTCPKIVQTVTDTEYWQSSMSADTTDAYGRHDLQIPSDVRIYHFAGTQHSGFPPLAPLPVSTGVCEQLPNANSYTWNLRAVVLELQRWVADGTPPPASRYARIRDQNLVRVEQVEFPTIPGVGERIGDLLNQRSLYFRGRDFDVRNLSGTIAVEPPVRIADYTTLVPQVDEDGNDVDGVRSVTLQAPLGTYTGWNTRRDGFSQGDACDLVGSFIPFARTAAQRQASGDPRRSLEERYGDHDGYVAAVARAASGLVASRFLRQEDAAAAVDQAQASEVLK